MYDKALYLRQILLSGWGVAGQERIVAASADVLPEGAPLAREIAGRYALAAGFAAVGPAAPAAFDRDRLAPPALVQNDAARDVVAAARLTLAAMLAVIRARP